MVPLSSVVRSETGRPAAQWRVLIADDEPDLAASLSWRLEQSGYEVLVVTDGLAAVDAVEQGGLDLVLLDLVLPSLNGLDVLRRIRSVAADLPVMLISGRSEEGDRIAGLEIGADDFVLKPFSPRELVARIGMVLRRSGRTSPRPDRTSARPDRFLQLSSLRIDRDARRVTVGEIEVQLSGKEYLLLVTLAESPDTVFSREDLLETVWPESSSANPGANLTEHISRLRRKIEIDPIGSLRLVTVRGVGYRLSPS